MPVSEIQSPRGGLDSSATLVLFGPRNCGQPLLLASSVFPMAGRSKIPIAKAEIFFESNLSLFLGTSLRGPGVHSTPCNKRCNR